MWFWRVIRQQKVVSWGNLTAQHGGASFWWASGRTPLVDSQPYHLIITQICLWQLLIFIQPDSASELVVLRHRKYYNNVKL